MDEISPHEPSSTTSRPSNSNSGGNHIVIAKCRRSTDVLGSNSNNDQETSEESDDEQHLLAVNCRAGKLGAAYYNLHTGQLYILDEIPDRPPSYQMITALLRQTAPLRMVMDGHQPSGFVQAVKRALFTDQEEARCKLSFVSAKEYSFEACKRRIYSLCLSNEPPDCSEEERTMFLRTVVDFNQTHSVHALGVLLKFLDLNWSNLNMDMQNKPQFFSLRKVSLADIVTIDEDTYRGLQIFSPVAHPSGFKKGVKGSNKEGLSLLHVFSKCASKVGHARMRLLMQHPTRDVQTLVSRQQVVEYFLRPTSDAVCRNICSSLRFIKNVNGILAKVKALSAKPFQWKSLYNTLYNAVLICELCESCRGVPLLEELAGSDNQKLHEVALYMNRIIDFELSKTERKFTVKAGVDAELDMKKQTMASLHTLMLETAKIELERLPAYIEECSMLYMPHLGYLLGVKAWAPDLTPQQMELPDMKFMFQNNDYIHYKSKGCEELDMMIGDTYPEIVAHETLIMMRLTTAIMENLDTLANVIDKCALLDCLIAMSKVAQEFNYVRPTLTNDKIIEIKQGRHPLHIITCDTFVPNDAMFSLQDGFFKILTGPNSSGKSVFMKQIGLIVYLAHIGSFVPAEAATIGIVSHIYSRIQSTECVATHMSAFLIDLRQMSLALQESSSNSLIIMDEFGKGTSEVDGLSLLAASVNTLLFQEALCPHVLMATHLLNIKEYIVNTPIVRFLRFEYMLQNDEPVFLFRVTEGATSSSLAHRVAAASGTSGDIITRAHTVCNSIMNNSLPPPNKRILAKLNARIDLINTELFTDDI